MKACIVILLFAFCYGDCRKIVPIDKSANTAFINMEGGGVRGAPANPASKPASPQQVPPTQPKPALPAAPVTTKPTPIVQQAPTQPKPTPQAVATPKPVNLPQPARPVTTPGPGTVKQLVTFYDSQGKASVIRPYSYSQAVKQG